VLLTSSSSPDDTWVSLETLLKPSFACGKWKTTVNGGLPWSMASLRGEGNGWVATPDPRWLAASGDVVIRSHLLEHRQRTFPPPWPVKFFLCVYDDDTSHGASFSVTSHNYFGRAINVLLPRTEKGQLTFSKNKKRRAALIR
jgi:hypothetical protein